MSDDTIKFVQGLIDISNALSARVDKLEKAARADRQMLTRAVTQLYHLGLRVEELDKPAATVRRWAPNDN